MKIKLLYNYSINNKFFKSLFIKIILIFIISINFIHIINYIELFKSFVNSKIEYKKIENFYAFCNNLKMNKLKKIKRLKNFKISIISPIYNSQRFISTLIKSIQIQIYSDIELILVDDYSRDNSVKIIEEYKKVDERIILIKNKRNKGTLINRNLGALYSKGKYLIFPDPDDILSKNILTISYKYAKKTNYDIIRFHMIYGNREMVFKNFVNELIKRPIYQPELSTYIFHGNKELEVIDCYLTNKLIKKELYIKSLNKLNNFYTNIYMIFMEDSLINFMLYKTANSLFYIDKIGYYYRKNIQSITNNLNKIAKIRIKFIFIYLKLIFEYSKSLKFEKDYTNLLFSNIFKYFNLFINSSDLNFNYYFIYQIINMHIKNKYINKEVNLIRINKIKPPLDRKSVV